MTTYTALAKGGAVKFFMRHVEGKGAANKQLAVHHLDGKHAPPNIYVRG